MNMKSWLINIGMWPQPDVVVEDELLTLAKKLTREQDTRWPERDGECKRAAVYAQIVNSLPDRNKRDVSKAIEEALSCGDY